MNGETGIVGVKRKSSKREPEMDELDALIREAEADEEFAKQSLVEAEVATEEELSQLREEFMKHREATPEQKEAFRKLYTRLVQSEYTKVVRSRREETWRNLLVSLDCEIRKERQALLASGVSAEELDHIEAELNAIARSEPTPEERTLFESLYAQVLEEEKRRSNG